MIQNRSAPAKNLGTTSSELSQQFRRPVETTKTIFGNPVEQETSRPTPNKSLSSCFKGLVQTVQSATDTTRILHRDITREMTEPQSTEKSADAANYDLTSQISPYLDLHMMFPLLEYIDSLISSGAISYNSLDVAQARLELLKPTHMVDYAMDIYREVHGEEAPIPQEMEDQKAGVFKELEELREGQASVDDLCRNEELRVSSSRKPRCHSS